MYSSTYRSSKFDILLSMHTALYRKYRPTDFDSVRDQDHIVTVLQGAIEKQQIPHALLFAGGRGTGKTTLARIFARAIGTSDIDIYEIDAASNRGIDDIRELREAVHTVPYESTYKVYIIDEVHMLTKEAFNALLKTLEEPPSHVVFILATTEEEKLLDTIRSRCQVFRFRSPSRTVLSETVRDVAKQEGFELESSAADLIALAADGSFRDALGITQKVLLASGDSVGSVDEVAKIIGAPRHEVIRKLLEALAKGDAETALSSIADAVSEHADMKYLGRLLLEHMRLILLIRHTPSRGDEYLARVSEEMRPLVEQLAQEKTINSHTLVRFLEAVEQVGRSPIPQLPLEAAVIDCVS